MINRYYRISEVFSLLSLTRHILKQINEVLIVRLFFVAELPDLLEKLNHFSRESVQLIRIINKSVCMSRNDWKSLYVKT